MKNAPTVKQIAVVCRHVDELMAEGVTENLAIRTLELFVDMYASLLVLGKPGPHHVNKVPLKFWSARARDLLSTHPDLKPFQHLRVEHGTPRRGLARKVRELHGAGELESQKLDGLIRSLYRLAVITLEEDRRLNGLSRSGMLDTPEARWQLAGIEF